MANQVKLLHEQAVFRSFLRAAQLPHDPGSVYSPAAPAPDIFCSTAAGDCYFELAEVLWDDPDPASHPRSLRQGLHQSEKASKRKAQLLATGREDEAAQIVTMGGFGAPPLGAVVQVLAKKAAKSYATDGLPVYLLLYYLHQRPMELAA